MKLKGIVITFSIPLLFIISGCSNNTQAIEVSVENEINHILYEQINALETEDVELYLSTLSETADKEKTKEDLLRLFYEQNLLYEVKSMETVSQTEDKATVKVTLVSKLRDNALFNEQKQTESLVIYQLVKENGEWKLFNTNTPTKMYTPQNY